MGRPPVYAYYTKSSPIWQLWTLVMGSNNGFKIYQTTNNFEPFYQIIQIIQIII
jgi:hypothetical protein